MSEETKLIPVLREGVDIVKLIFYKKLRSDLNARYRDEEPSYSNLLAGAIINELFGAPNLEEQYVSFVRENEERIRMEMEGIADRFHELRIPLTDALRIQFLCDSQDGIDSAHVLEQANKLHILIVDRDVPLPAQFMSLVRKLGASFGILSGI